MWLSILLPYAVALGAWAIVTSHDYHQDGIVSTFTFVAGFWLMFLTIVRQVFTLLDNQHLTGQLRAFNANLEQTVAQRTRQLASLNDLTKAVHNTLRAEQTLSSAMEHTQNVLEADGVVLALSAESTAASLDPALSYATALPNVLHRGLDAWPLVVDRIGTLHTSDRVEDIELASLSQVPVGESAARQEPVFDDHSRRLPEGTYLRAPMLWQGQVLGTIGVVRWNGGFSPTEKTVLENIGIEVAAAYQNARIHAIALETADRDSITGLYNHRAIQQRLEEELARAERMNRPLALVMMDLNNFKLFNDTYGHPVGDQVLKNVASALRSGCRQHDSLGRYGGDEFIAVLPETDLPLAMVVAQRWLDRMALEGFNEVGEDRTIPVTLSFGIATFPHDSANRHELVAIADANLYAAKISERGIVSTSDMQRQNREMRTESSFDVLDAMVNAVDNKDHYTRRHSEDVTEYALWIAEELGLSEETMRIVRLAGLLHDVGKIGVPETILRKPGRLTNEEFDIMKQHAQFGAYIVGGVPGMDKILPGVRSHHERWDGKGYPEGLAGDSIPLLGRILAVADACSAMTTSRTYRTALSWENAVKEIEGNSATQFDPTMARAFLRAARRKRPRTEPTAPHLQLISAPKTSRPDAPDTPHSTAL